jgi:hypothetical protein
MGQHNIGNECLGIASSDIDSCAVELFPTAAAVFHQNTIGAF